ncbi:hypothetical protein [Devosia naphthalenivorans]|uniref:hypothetical protein n=1 Tax=Devosia naphthalenivorans TaxID=2082392 RepID=UPI0013B05BF7|nr:hypothetical protein [Devosia naphthalenivorans]
MKSHSTSRPSGATISISPTTLNDISDELGRVCSAIFAVTMAAQTLHPEEGGAIMQVNGDSMNKIEAVRAKIENIVHNAMLKTGSPTLCPPMLSTMSVDDLCSAEKAVLAARHIMVTAATSHGFKGSDDGLDARRNWANEQFERLDAELLAIVLELDRRDITDEVDQLTYVNVKASAFAHLSDPDYDIKLVRAAS